MRPPVDAARVRALARELSNAAREPTTLYLTGGSTAVIEGWRASTVDVDLRLEPDSDALLRRIAEVKNQLDINIERGFEQDLRDVQSMVKAELVDPRRVVNLFVEVEPMLFRYPAIDAGVLRAKVERAFKR